MELGCWVYPVCAWPFPLDGSMGEEPCVARRAGSGVNSKAPWVPGTQSCWRFKAQGPVRPILLLQAPPKGLAESSLPDGPLAKDLKLQFLLQAFSKSLLRSAFRCCWRVLLRAQGL